MNTQQLECFTALASNLNYARTAEQLSLTQPAVSRQIQSLEAEIGVRLFNRTTRSVSLTQAGMQFLPDAQQMLNIYYHSLERISHFHSSSYYVLRIGYSDSQANRLISEILRPLLSQNGNITPELVLDQTDANLHRLDTGQLDLVLGMQDAHYQDAAISFQKLHDDRFQCVIRKDHPLSHKCQKEERNQVSSDDLWPIRQIINIPPYLLRNTFSRSHWLVPVNDKLDNVLVSTISEAYNLALAGVGYTLIPEYLIIPHPELCFFTWEQSPSAPMGIYYRSSERKNKDSVPLLFIQKALERYSCTVPSK